MKGFKLLYLIGAIFILITMSISSKKQQISEQQAVIDSLEMEIQLRDNLINHTKDTIYGEEKTN